MKTTSKAYLVLAVLVSALFLIGNAIAQNVPDGTNDNMIELTCLNFIPNESIPELYTCDGKDFSPQLYWSGVPGDAKSIALICDDPDAPGGTWVHWVIFNIPPGTQRLPDNITTDNPVFEGVVLGKNDFGNIGYGGPCPPKGHGVHRYYFKIYALDVILNLKEGVTKKELENAMKTHILAKGELMGTYKRD